MSLLAPNNKALIVAMDHGRTLGVVPGLEDPAQVIEAAIEAGADGIMTSFGVVKRYRERLIGRIPTIIRLDGGPSEYREDWRAYTEWSLLHTVEDALFLGADGVVVNLFLDSPVELETYRIIARVAAECMRVKLPLMVETMPCRGKRITDPDSVEVTAAAARLAFEHGADMVKAYYTGDVEAFRQVVTGCPVPLLIAGGPKMDTTQAALQVVHDALQAGAGGVVFGRNIWQSGQTARMIAALKHIIHHDGSVNEAMQKLS